MRRSFRGLPFSVPSIPLLLRKLICQVIEWKLEKLTKENPKNQDSYSQLIYLCSNIRNLHIAMLIFTSMEAQGVQPTSSIFNALIFTSLSSGNLLTALSLFEIMEGSESYKPDSDTYNAFILAYSNMGNKNATESWFAAKRASGFSPDVLVYGCLIQCCIKSKHFEDAHRYFEEMMLAGVDPNESVFQNVLLMYCKERNCARIKEILKFTLNGSWQIDRSIAKRVVNLYHELRRVEELEELLRTMTESNQTSEVLSLVHCSIIRLYSDTDRLDDVEYSVGRMLKNGIPFSCSEDVEKIICCYFRREAYDRLELFLECVRDSYKFARSNYDLLCAGYKRAGLLERLNVVVNEMRVAGFV